MEYLYRYRNLNNFKAIEEMLSGKMFASSPARFNDPFEWKPRFEITGTMKQQRKNILNFVNYHFPNISKNEAQRRTEHILKIPVITKIKDFESDILSFRSQCSVICFSETCKSNLMWSHYSNSHEGLCFQFNIRLLNRSGFDFHKIKYTNTYPTFDPYREISSTDPVFAENISLTKSEDWKYEKEYRALFLLKKEGIVSFSPESITSVIIGCKCNKENEDKIRYLVETLNHKPKVVKAKMHPSKYELIINI